jgi:hypothetical protein
MDRSNEADDRWRDVLFELVKRAKGDAEFRARVEATGAVIDNLEALLEPRAVENTSASGGVVCQTYWWGFQLEIPHRILRAWSAETPDSETVASEIGTVTGPASPFRRRTASWVASRVVDLQAHDRGAGVYVSMTWMAPNIFVATPIRVDT